MTNVDHNTPELVAPDLNFIAYVRGIIRLILLVALLLGGSAIYIIVRIFEWPLLGKKRPVSGYITKLVCQISLLIIGLKLFVSGRPMNKKGAIVSNHISWLDIFVLNSQARMYFVAKSEVSAWPIIGWLANLTGTIFIRRNKLYAKSQIKLFEDCLIEGQRVLFFPEGTSSDGVRVLPFKSTLFESFFGESLKDLAFVQPASISYFAPNSKDTRFYAWFGEMSFVKHFFWVLSSKSIGHINLKFYPELKVSSFSNRKKLAEACFSEIQEGFTRELKEVKGR